MYFNMFGGSALLHLLAGHPRVVAAFGIAATVTMLVSPLGPGKHGGSEAYVAAIDRTIPSRPGLDSAAVVQARNAADQLAQMPKSVIHEAVQDALAACGAACVELTPAIVERDPKLLHDALLIYQIDVIRHLRESRGQELDIARR
jgi:hypothetical protein